MFNWERMPQKIKYDIVGSFYVDTPGLPSTLKGSCSMKVRGKFDMCDSVEIS